MQQKIVRSPTIQSMPPGMEERSRNNVAIQRALSIVKWFSTNKYNENDKQTRMHELNTQIKNLCEKKRVEQLSVFTKESVMTCLRPLLTDNYSKDQIVAYFRHVMISPEVCDLFKKYNIPLLICRILEKENKDTKGVVEGIKRQPDKEILQCIKFLLKWMDLSPRTIPRLLVNGLVAFSELPIDETRKDSINIQEKKAAVSAIRKLSTCNPEVCAWSGGINVLLNSILDPQLEQLSTEIVCTIIFLINEPNCRNKIFHYLDLSRIFWIFTDIDYNPDKKDIKQQPAQSPPSGRGKLQAQLDLAKKAIIIILKSWVGLVYLGNKLSILRSFVESLRQKIRPEVRTAIYQVLESVLMIGNNSGFRQKDSNNKLRIGNLLNCYLVTLVQLLIKCDLFKILVELSGLEDTIISVPAQKFLKQLTILMFNSLPDSSRYIDFLIASVTQDQQASASLKSCSSFVINKIGNYVFDKKPRQQTVKLLNQLQNLYTPSNLLIPVFSNTAQANYMISLMSDGDSDLKQKSIYQNTAILRQSKQKPQKWKWEAIQQILKHPYDNKTKNLLQGDRNQQNKLIKYLLRFFSPTKRQFIAQPWHLQSFKFIKVGQLLVKNILNVSAFIKLINDPSPSQFDITVSFIDELKQSLIALLLESESKKKTRSSFYLTLQRELIVWIGLFSETKKGFLELLVNNDFFELLQEYIERPGCQYILSVLLTYFDYNKDNYKKGKGAKEGREVGPRDFLEKCLLRGSKQLALQSIQVLKMLYKMEVPGFNNWGFKIYSRWLKVKDFRTTELLEAFMEAMQEIFQDQENVMDFLQVMPQEELAKLRESLSSSFLINLLIVEKGFNYVKQQMGDWLDNEYSRWLTQKNIKYNEYMEDLLNQAFNFAQPTSYTGFIIREPTNQLDYLFLYKLPWNLKIDDQTFPLYFRNGRNSFRLQAETNVRLVKSPEILLMIGEMPVDEHFSYGKHNHSQNIMIYGDKAPKRIELKLSEDRLLSKAQKRNGLLELTENGVTFYFQQRNDKVTDIFYLVKIKIQVKVLRLFDNSQLPKHLLGQLAKTQLGISYMKSKKTVEFLKEQIERGEPAPQVRGALWAIGHIGSSRLGMDLIKQHNILDILIKMSQSDQKLSVRGSCRYILNMFGGSNEGREEVAKQLWLPSQNSKVGWTRTQDPPENFFKIDRVEENYWASNDKAWEELTASLEPLNQNEKKFMNHVTMLASTPSHKYAWGQIRQALKPSEDLKSSARLLKNILLHLSYYRFPAAMRRSIFTLFDEILRNQSFLKETKLFSS